MPLVRMVAVWVDAADDPKERMTVDVGVDASGKFSSKYMTFGFFGSAKENSEKFWTFALRSNGQIAFGHDEENPDTTNYCLNIANKKIEVGEYLTLTWDDGEEYTYRIVSTLNMSEVFA